MKTFALSARPIVALAALLLIAACIDPTMGPERAQAYFTEHRAELERIVRQVELCQPETGKIERIDHIQCSSSEGKPQNLIDAMTAADARWISAHYTRGEGDVLTLARVRIVMHAYGFSFAGEIESFDFETASVPSAAYERRDDGIAVVERQPLTEAPHRWYWWRIDR